MSEVPVVDLTALPKLAATDVRLLWVNDWYEGPLEAVVEYSGEQSLMVLHPADTIDVEQPMRWVLFRLSPEQWKDEERWHALFEEHVGVHWCFHSDEPPPEPAHPRDATRFFGPHAQRAPSTLAATSAVGWVDEMPTR
jgi:hypothetical protein